MLLRRLGLALPLLVAACSADEGTPPAKSLDSFLPTLPTPDGTPQSVYAGAITQANPQELIPGPAESGMVGDYFMRNSRARFVIQSEARVIGVVPWGGNLVDAVPLDAAGHDASEDQFGEMSLVYLLGRTCGHDRVEVLRDGAGGGPAVIRATGKGVVNDYVDLRGLGFFQVPHVIDPDVPDDVQCATTYTLAPDSDTLEVTWSLFNAGTRDIQGPLGVIDDVGGEVQVFAPGAGFTHLQGGFDVLLNPGQTSPTAYNVYQGPHVAYGIIPHLGSPDATAGGLVVAGVAVFLYGGSSFLDALDRDKDFLHLPAGDGVTSELSFVVAHDGARPAEVYHELYGQPSSAVSGKVVYAPGGAPGARARVTVNQDTNNNGQIDADEPVVTYLDAQDDGTYAGHLAAGKWLLRADVPDVARSQVVPVTVGATPVSVPELSLPQPARFEFTVVDDATDEPIAAKLSVLGRSPVPLDPRFFSDRDRQAGVVRLLYAVHGESQPAGDDPADAPILLPAGGPYRIFASHGPEWSVASVLVPSAAAGSTQTLTFRLRRVIDTAGYVATGFHQHSLASPDSPVNFHDRVATLVVEGIELFATTDHDNLVDFDPIIDEMGLRGSIDAVVGVEATPFAYGHFNAYPLTPTDDDPSHGAVNWGASAQAGYAMLPGEIWGELRDRGARVVQVNHPRQAGFESFQAYFNRAGLSFDFDHRTITGLADLQEVPSEWLRLPLGQTLYSNDFDALEVWIKFETADSDGDGVREFTVLDRCLTDYFNFISFGKMVAPVGNSDTHTIENKVAGLPRSYIAVPDDSPAALRAGLADDVFDSILGVTPQDIVVTNGPFLRVSADGGATSAIGRVIAAEGGKVTLRIEASAPEWVDFDTLEVFANLTTENPDPRVTSLQPLACWSSREPATMGDTDPCKLAALGGGAQPLAVELVDAGGGAKRRQATVDLTLAASDIATRAGASGQDAWLVVRVRGQRAELPVILTDAIDDDNLDALVADPDSPASLASLQGRGVFATAFTAAIKLDFDGGGWRAPFSP